MKQNKGFTLIEVMIATMVLGVVLAAGYGVLHFVNTTMKSQIAESDTRKAIRNIVEQITKDIQESSSVTDENGFVEPSGDTIRYYYNDTKEKLIREVNGAINIEYDGIKPPFSIAETQTNLFQVTLNAIEGIKVLKPQQFYVARNVGTNIDTGETGGDTPSEILSDFALLTPGDVSLDRSPVIKGNVGTESGNIYMAQSEVDGKVYAGSTPILTGRGYTITGGAPILDTSIQYRYNMPDIPEAPDISNKVMGTTNFGWYPLKSAVTEDTYFENLEIDNYMEVDVSHGDINIHTKSLDIAGGSSKNGDKIILKGSGKLRIYVDDTFTENGSSYINKGGGSKNLTILLKTSDFCIADSCIFNCSIYCTTGNVELKGSASVTGSIIAGGTELSMTGGGVAMNGAILAPNATVDIQGSRVVNGWVIGGGKATLGGRTQINYAPITLEIP